MRYLFSAISLLILGCSCLTEPSTTSVAKPKTETPEGSPGAGQNRGTDAKAPSAAMGQQAVRVAPVVPQAVGAPGCGAP
ncbi:MAG: hypothetical protein QM784_14535 [Polyangiaceae bacterium]